MQHEEIGLRVAALRAANHESLREAAGRTGVSHTTIARIEKGQVAGCLDSTLRKIAQGYGVSIESLMGEQLPAPDPNAPDLDERLVESLVKVTGITPLWFRWGILEHDPAEPMPPRQIRAYVEVIHKAALAGIEPRLLEQVLQLLIRRLGPAKLTQTS